MYPNPGELNSKTFTSVGDGWITFSLPKNCNNIMLVGTGGGGGGGNGMTGASGTNRGGGGGGSAGATTRVIYPRDVLPDVIFIRVGKGGTATNPGTSTIVSLWGNVPTSIVNSIFTANGGIAGGTGTAVAAGAGGNAASATTLNNANYMAMGVFNSMTSQPGTNGGAHTGATGTDVSFPTFSVGAVSCGTGGAGTPIANTNFRGGDLNGVAHVPVILGGLAGSNRGNNGVLLQKPFYSTGGTGGGSNGTGAGGNGGDGAFGGGGGGGGGAGTTGGTGGRGGDGFLKVSWW